MAFLNTLTAQLSEMFLGQSPLRKMILLAMVLGSIGAMVWLTIQANTTTKVVLFSNMDPVEAGEAVRKLRSQNIEVELDDGGTTLKVPRKRSDDAIVLLSMEGIPNSGTVGFELMDKSSIGQSKFQQEKNYLRMRQGEMARTLQSIREIERARVHLSIPEQSLFVQDEQQPKAAIKVTLRSGTRLTQRQISGIVHLVSHSVEGLAPENVSIIDQMGNLINISMGDGGSDASSIQQTFKTRYEDLLKSRIESMLEKVVGRTKVAARVQADFDFSTKHEVTETFNPNGDKPIINNEQILIEGGPATSKTAIEGAPGSSSNLPFPDNVKETVLPGEGPKYREDRTTDYAVSRTVQQIDKSMPTPIRVTVAVVVDGKYETVTTGDGESVSEFQPRTKDELKQLEDLVKSTIGFNDEHNDIVTVECVPFMIEEMEEEVSPLADYDKQQMIELIVKWAVVGLIGLLLIMMVLRPAIKQIIVTAPQATALPAGMAGALGESGTGQLGMNPAGNAPQSLESSATQTFDEIKKTLTPEAKEALKQSMGGEDVDEILRKAELAYAQSAGSSDDEKHQAEAIAGRNHAMHMMARQAKITQAMAQKIHDEVVQTSKDDPNKTVSLIRQWMDEA